MVEYSGLELTWGPTLSDYYKLSKEMQENQMVFIGVVGMDGGYLIYKMELFF